MFCSVGVYGLYPKQVFMQNCDTFTISLCQSASVHQSFYTFTHKQSMSGMLANM